MPPGSKLPRAIRAVGAAVTAVFAIRAFGKQTEEVRTLERQTTDQRELTRQQGALLEVQSDQRELQRQQLGEQRALNARQTDVLELQARELSESLDGRKRLAGEQRRAQASQVAAWFGPAEFSATVGGIVGAGLSDDATAHYWGAFIRNESALPILSVRVFFHFIAADSTASEAWQPIMRGGPVDRIRVIPPRSVRFIQIPEQIRRMIDSATKTSTS